MVKRPHIAIIGAGAVGGYVGGHLARAGEDVTFIDRWVGHINTIKAHGVRVSGTQGDHLVRVSALHISEVQSLLRKPVDIAIIATKSLDTAWVAAMIRDYRSPDAFVVSMQSSINEETITAVVGWGRTLGCVLNTIGVSTVGPGHLTRHPICIAFVTSFPQRSPHRFDVTVAATDAPRTSVSSRTAYLSRHARTFRRGRSGCGSRMSGPLRIIRNRGRFTLLVSLAKPQVSSVGVTSRLHSASKRGYCPEGVRHSRLD